MAVIKCKMCGGDLVLQPDSTVAECEYCGTVQTVPTQDNEKKLTLFNRAIRLRYNCEFDKAAGIYESIVADFPEEAEAYWGLVLCKYGIEYVDDPATGRKIPTCHRSSFESVLRDSDFEQAMENADAAARRVYREEAKAIENIRRGILDVSANEKPYDIFICYKETDDSGNRTLDSLLAQDIYDALTARNYRVFFSRITLEDKLGQAYEPYIFAALNSAKIMLAVGTCYEHYNAVWVKNEWSRFLKLMAQDKSKYLFPCYKNIDPYDIPAEFSHLQGQDMGKIGAMQDLLRGIAKILDPLKKQVQVKETVILERSSSAAPLLRRAFLFLEDGDWANADEYCEKVLDQDPENALAYVGKLMAQLHVRKQENLKDCREPFDDQNHYRKAIRFADEALEAELTGYNAHIRERNETARKAEVYNNAVKRMDSADTESAFQKAAEQFESIPGFRDAEKLAKQCREKIEAIQAEKSRMEEEKARVAAQKKQEQETQRKKNANVVKKRNKTAAILAVIAAVCAVGLLLAGKLLPKEENQEPQLSAETETVNVAETTVTPSPEEQAYAEAAQWEAEGQLARAAIAFYNMGDYEDARQRSFEIWSTITERNVVCSSYKVYGNSKDVIYAGVKQDGTVIVSSKEGNTKPAPFDVSGWSDVVSVCGGANLLLGLRSDGTMLSAYWEQDVPLDVSEWRDVVWTNYVSSLTENYVIGLKADGTVLTAGTSTHFDLSELSDWSDIAQIYQCGSYTKEYILGLKIDGTVVHIGKLSRYSGNKYTEEPIETSGWTNIVDIQAGYTNIVGLQANGTVVATGDNSHGQCDVSAWTDIVAIGNGSRIISGQHGLYTVGLRSDGTVVTAGYIGEKSDLDSLSQWTDIEKISVSGRHVAGLRSDGTVVAGGFNNQYCTKVSHMTDVEQIITGYALTAGLRSDGKLVLAGASNYIPKSPAEWEDIQYITHIYPGVYAWRSDGTLLYQSFHENYNFDLTGWTNMKIPTTPKQPVSFGTEPEAPGMPLLDPSMAYAEAEALLAAGETAKAAIAFGKLGDYADARERSFELWDKVVMPETISTGYQHTIGLKSDGTVVTVGYTGGLYEGVSDWQNIISVSAGAQHTVGLKSDGTVVVEGKNDNGQCEVSDWRGIMAVSAGYRHTVGLKADGTVVAVGGNNAGQCEVAGWQNVVAVNAGPEYTLGLKSDGTVVSAGLSDDYSKAVSAWQDIVAVSGGVSHVVGLKADGTVVAVGENKFGECEVSAWQDIVAVSAAYHHTVGLKSDGTVVAVGNNKWGQGDVSGWRDIVAVSAEDSHVVALKADGTAVAVGYNESRQCNVKGWTDIKLPNS